MPLDTYLRMMALKFRHRLGDEPLCREVGNVNSKWIRRSFSTAADLADPSVAAEQLHLLVEGAIVRAVSGQRETAAASAQAVAAALLAAGDG